MPKKDISTLKTKCQAMVYSIVRLIGLLVLIVPDKLWTCMSVSFSVKVCGLPCQQKAQQKGAFESEL